MTSSSATKKCIVLDLDNTLWGGVVGEDGIDGIQLSLKAPGNSFVAFQQALLDLYNRGVLLAINSRNNPDDALAVIRTHPNMILKEANFAAQRINWQDKAENIKELAQELNIGLDSMVFLDDDPTNRALVRAMVPEVEVPELPADPLEYARFLHSLPYFPANATTDEDTMRGNLYVTERLRREQEKSHTSKEDFLKSLKLELSIFEDDGSCLPRLSQLTEKTNQFNVDKQPLTEEEIKQYIESPTHKVYYARLTDTFGDYGVVLFALVELQGKVWHIKQLLMSCRVFGRGVEDAFLSVLAKRALQDGADILTIAYNETSKNIPAKEFIDKYFSNQTCKTAEVPQSPEWIQTKYANI
jgi:FkbH-like protein